MRRTIAERLRHSLSTAAPVTLTREVDAETLVATRSRLATSIGYALPYDALFVKILAVALRERPELNAFLENDTILLLDEVNVGFAVAVSGGLIVPVVHNADTRPLAEIAAAVRDLSDKAREGQLRPADVTGGTATITNLGRYGVDGFTPILNPPQSVILGIGRILPRPVVRDGQLATAQTCVLSLTFDHRVADGVPAAELLELFTSLMADEERLANLL